jgi:hypothetical protein
MMTTIWRYDRSGTAIRWEDEVTEERALTIYLNDTLSCTHGISERRS